MRKSDGSTAGEMSMIKAEKLLLVRTASLIDSTISVIVDQILMVSSASSLMICLHEFLPGFRRRYRSYHLLLGRVIARPISNNSSCIFPLLVDFQRYVPFLDLFQTYFRPISNMLYVWWFWWMNPHVGCWVTAIFAPKKLLPAYVRPNLFHMNPYECG